MKKVNEPPSVPAPRRKDEPRAGHGRRVRAAGEFIRALWNEIFRSQLTDVAAQLAYNALLAFFPFLIFLVTILRYLPVQGLANEVLEVAHRILPGDSAALVDETVEGVLLRPHGNLLVISLAGAMWAASSGVASFTTALNHAYEAVETRSWIRVRAQSLLITVVAVVLLIVAMTTLLVGPLFAERIAGWLGLGDLVPRAWSLLRWPATVLAMSSLLAMFYWACPNVRHPFRLVSAGTLVAMPSLIAVSLLFRFYVGHLASFNRTYGALGAGVVLMVWLYLSGFILLVGGVINALVERERRDPKVEPPDPRTPASTAPPSEGAKEAP